MQEHVAPETDSPPVIYLDYNATAPLRPEALEAMLPVLRSVGNAASPHRLGQDAAARVTTARHQLADLLGCSPGELIFTSGATEANNLALRSAVARGGQLIISAVEHPAIRETAHALASDESGDPVVLPVDRDGLLDLDALQHALQSGGVALVSIMAANNETGVLSDLDSIVKIAHEAGALVHTDATQFVGRRPLELSALDVDLLSLSAHKFGGPQGVGALFIRRGTRLPQRPVLYGGGQEDGWRAGTLNVAGIVGTGAAAAAAHAKLGEESARTALLRDLLEEAILTRLADARINGHRQCRLPNVSSLTFPGAPADAILTAMPNIAASDGSACASGAVSPSHVLLAMGRTREEAECTVRFSLGYATTRSETERAARAVVAAVIQVRSDLVATARS